MRLLRMTDDPIEHDFTQSKQGWGHAFQINKIKKKGKILEGLGWWSSIRKNDYFILSNGEATTRYRVTKIRYSTNVDDMFYVTLKFAPRN